MTYASPVGFGAYVDLGWDDANAPTYAPLHDLAGAPSPLFQQSATAGWHPRFPSSTSAATPASTTPGPGTTRTTAATRTTTRPTATTSSTTTSPTDQRPAIDEGTNGLDDDGVNGVDDPLERETSPPYPVPPARREGDPAHLRTRRPPGPRDERDESFVP